MMHSPVSQRMSVHTPAKHKLCPFAKRDSKKDVGALHRRKDVGKELAERCDVGTAIGQQLDRGVTEQRRIGSPSGKRKSAAGKAQWSEER